MTNEPQQLTTEESAAWVRLVALAELLPVALDAQLQRDDGITHFEYVALMSLADAPERINEDPYGEGWIFIVEPSDAAQVEALLDAEGYRALIEG